MTNIYLRKKYKGGTSSANQLAKDLKIRCINLSHVFKPKELSDSLIINWGSSKPIEVEVPTINKPSSVGIAANKLLTYQQLSHTCPDLLIPWWTSIDTIEYKGRIVARTKLTGSCGDGIITFKKGDIVQPEARFYTKYIKNRVEFRVHCGVISNTFDYFIQRKRRLTTEELEARGIYDRDLRIRNVSNGYIYSSNLDIDTELESKIALASQRVLTNLSLDFGAVDVLYDTNKSEVYVLEVNTAPGIESELSRNFYVTYFTQLIETLTTIR